jgi:2-desacetyl-2-hydroxyethyl bacteriochlorophyllide A dehydrogenase
MTGTDIPGTVRTAVITGPRTVEVRDLPLPEPGPADIVVRTHVSGISAGTEMNVYRGRAPQWRTRQDPQTGLFTPTDEPDWSYPLAYGYAAVGQVVAAGAEVSSPAVGDWVFTYTPHASHTVLPAADAVPLPELADPRVGVLTANLNTALNGVLDARPTLGDTVTVFGLGVIGLLVVQLLRRAGVHTVIGVDAVAERREAALRFGADHVLPAGSEVAPAVRALTGNRGADIAIEVSGAAPALNEAIRTVGVAGKVVALSWYGGTFESLSLAGEFHHNRPRIIASQVGAVNFDLGPLWSVDRRKALVGELLTRLDLTPLLTHTLPVERAAEAYKTVDEGAEGLIQLLLDHSTEGHNAGESA